MSSLSCPQHQARSWSPAFSCQPSHWRDLSTTRSTLRIVPHFPFTHLEVSKAFLALSCPSPPAFPSTIPFSLIPKVQVFIHSPKVAPPTSGSPQRLFPGVCVYMCVLAQSLLLAPLCQVNPYSLGQSCPKRSLPLEATLVATITIMSWATHFLATLPPLL